MGAISVGIRELKTRLGKYMERVQAGGIVIITDRGKPVGRIIPVGTSVEAQVQELVAAGLLAWSGKKLVRRAPVAHTRGKHTVSDLLIEDRE
jgi:prevent-host-death family protein